MHLSTFRIINYKSFENSRDHNLSSGINVVVGPNNVGKTALLEMLSLNFSHVPHRSQRTPRLQKSFSHSAIVVEFEIEGSEVAHIFPPPCNFHIAMPNPHLVDERLVEENLAKFFHGGILRMKMESNSGGIKYIYDLPYAQIALETKISPNDFFGLSLSEDLKVSINGRSTGSVNNFHYILYDYFKESTYMFKSERLNIGVCQHGNNNILRPDASNLAETLNILKSNPKRFDKLNDHIREIFPNIHEIAVRPLGNDGSQVEIVVWTVDPDSERDDLVIPLSACGTGIGQVLAMLYVVITSDVSRTIIIDEPNSFLHPGAARKLIEILHMYSHHQYILSTHSPEIIQAAEPDKILLLRWEDASSQSVIEEMDRDGIDSQERIFREIGVRFSDVFGADSIIWVEGATEAECFPLILSRIANLRLGGTRILAVRNTGDFDNKRYKRAIIDIYKRLSSGGGLMPPAVAFVFDRETRTPEELQDIERESDGDVHFLPRRTYENYLVSPRSIAAAMTSVSKAWSVTPTEDSVEKWIVKNGGKKIYCGKNVARVDISDTDWLSIVDAPKLLNDLYGEFSNNKETFRKTRDSILITQNLIDRDSAALRELADYLESITVLGGAAKTVK